MDLHLRMPWHRGPTFHRLCDVSFASRKAPRKPDLLADGRIDGRLRVRVIQHAGVVDVRLGRRWRLEHVVFAPQGFVGFISPAEIVADGLRGPFGSNPRRGATVQARVDYVARVTQAIHEALRPGDDLRPAAQERAGSSDAR